MDYIQEIDTHFAELAKQEQAERGGGPIRGSALGHCTRRLYAKLNKLEQQPITPRSKRIFSLGEDRDIRLTDALRSRLYEPSHHQAFVQREVWTPLPPPTTQSAVGKDAAVIEKYNQSFGGIATRNERDTGASLKREGQRLWIRSRIDFVWWNPAAGMEIVEVKTMGSYPFEKAKKEGVAGIGSDYHMQLIAQWHGLHSEGHMMSRFPGWLIENKDTSELLHVPFEITSDRLRALESRLEEIHQMLWNWVAGAPLDAVHCLLQPEFEGALPWQCNYCDIGPVVGRCCPTKTLKNTAKEGEIPKWRASASPSSEPA